MTTPNPFRYTEEALRGFVLDCLEKLSQPLCPVVFASTFWEWKMWDGLLQGLENERNAEVPGLAPVEG